MLAEDDGALVRRAVEEIRNGGELDVADVLFAPHYVNHGGLVPDLVRGPEAIKIGVALYRTAFPGLHVSVRGPRVEGDTVVLRWVARGALSVATPGGLPNGVGDRLTGVTRSRVEGGQIAESWTRWDRRGALGRLDLVR